MFSSGLLLCKNSNKQNNPQVGFIEIIWRKKQLFNLPWFGYFLIPFLFRWAKHVAEKNGYLGHVIRKGLNAYLEGSW